MIGYCNVKSFDPGATNDVLVTNGRCSLLSMVVHAKSTTANASVIPLQFRNGSASGDILYKFRSWATVGSGIGNNSTFEVDMGGDGILFTDGIYFEWESASGTETEGVDHLVLFFTGGKAV